MTSRTDAAGVNRQEQWMAKGRQQSTKSQNPRLAESRGSLGSSVGVDVFEPVAKRTTMSKVVMAQIVSLLSEGKLQPGDRLPAERDLAALLGIGRPSVREALSALVLLGVVEQRQGRGTFLVDRIDRLPVEPYLYQLLLDDDRAFDDLLEVRQLLEPAIAALAAERSTEDDRARIRRALGVFERQVSSGDDVDAEAAAGADFHTTLARATGNQTLARLVESMRELLRATGHVLNEREGGASLEAHRALADAILSGDAPLAESLMRRHLEDVSDRLSIARAQAPAEERSSTPAASTTGSNQPEPNAPAT